MKAIDINETKEYICGSEKGSENPTIFVIGVLKKKEKAEFMSFSQTVDPEKTDISALMEMNEKVLLSGLKKIKGIEVGGSRKDIDVIDRDVIEMLPGQVISEVAAEILKNNMLAEADAKN